MTPPFQPFDQPFQRLPAFFAAPVLPPAAARAAGPAGPAAPARLAPGPGACATPQLRQQYRNDPQVMCYAHCRNARQSSSSDLGARFTPLRPAQFNQCMAACRTCEASRRFWHGAIDPDRLDRVLEEDEEFQDLKAEWEASNHECEYCEERMNQILAYYNRPPPRYYFP